jgi:PGF-pre-PGF domain-containing protein
MRARTLVLAVVVVAVVAWPVGSVTAVGAAASTGSSSAGSSSVSGAAGGVAAVGPRVNVSVDGEPVSGGTAPKVGDDPELTVTAAVGNDTLSGGSVSEIVVRLNDEGYTTVETDNATVTERIDLDLQTGDNEVRVIVTDDAGNVDATQFTVRKDSDPPYVFLTSPYETTPWRQITDGETSGRTVTLTGQIIEDSAVEKILLRHEFGDYGKTYVFREAQRNFTLNLTLGYSGADARTNEFRLTSVDEFGNVRVDEFAINHSDAAPPAVSFRPLPNETTRNRLTVSGTVSDDVWIQRANVTIRRPDGNRSGFDRILGPRSYELDTDRRTATFEKSFYLLRPGTYEATVAVTDVRGRTTTRTVTVDRVEGEERVAPTVTVDRDRTVVLDERTLFLSGTAYEGVTERLVIETRDAATGETVDYRVVHSGSRETRVDFDREVGIAPGRTTVIVRATDPSGTEHARTFAVNGSAKTAFVGDPTDPDESDEDESENTTDEPAGNGTAEDRWPVVAVEPLVDGRAGTTSASVTVRRAPANTTVAVPAADGRGRVAGTENVTLTGMNVSVTRQTNLTATVTTRDRSAGTLSGPVDARVAGSVTIQHSLSGANVAGTTLSLSVDRAYLEAHDIDPANVTLYRLSAGNWSAVPTDLVRTGPFASHFRADSPGLSVFSLAAPPVANESASDGPTPPAGNGTENGTDTDSPLFPGTDTDWEPPAGRGSGGAGENGSVDGSPATNGTVGNGTVGNGTAPNGTVGNGTAPNGTVGNSTDANETAGGGDGSTGSADIAVLETAVNRTEAGVNDSVAVDVTLRNSGTSSGTYTAALYERQGLNRSFVAEKEVRVPAGQNWTVTFVTAFQQPGNHTVSVNGTQGGPVTVSKGGGGGGLLSMFAFLPLELIGMIVGGIVGLALVLVLVRFVLRRVGGSGDSAGG